jgi:Tfp pilus assembly protein PilO
VKTNLRPDLVWNLSLALALVFFTGSLAFALMPQPDPNRVNATFQKTLKVNEAKLQMARTKAAKLQADNISQLWMGDAEAIGARSLDNVSKIAKARGVKLNAFRPQRPVQSAELEHIPFLTIVEGSYPAVVSFLKTLEQPSLKLAVNSVQVTATDGTSDSVSASIVLIAFRDSSVKVQKKKTNGTDK